MQPNVRDTFKELQKLILRKEKCEDKSMFFFPTKIFYFHYLYFLSLRVSFQFISAFLCIISHFTTKNNAINIFITIIYMSLTLQFHEIFHLS